MNLFTTCNACRQQFSIKSSADTRPELEREKGLYFSVKCPHCGRHQKKHVNDVRARASVIIIVGGLVIGLAVTIGLFLIYQDYIVLLLLSLPILIWRQHSERISVFNQYTMGR